MRCTVGNSFWKFYESRCDWFVGRSRYLGETGPRPFHFKWRFYPGATWAPRQVESSGLALPQANSTNGNAAHYEQCRWCPTAPSDALQSKLLSIHRGVYALFLKRFLKIISVWICKGAYFASIKKTINLWRNDKEL